jgi:hypothetical protein
MKTMLFCMGALFVFLGIYRTVEARKQYEPNKLEIFVSGACQRLAFESGDEPLTFRVVNTLGYSSEAQLAKSTAYHPTVVEIPTPGSLSLGYRLEVVKPNGELMQWQNRRSNSNNRICLEYILIDAKYNTDLIEVKCRERP